MTKVSKILSILTVTLVAGVVFSANAAWDSTVYIGNNVPSCSPKHEQLRGKWNCIKEIDSKSCINTVPVKSSTGYGITSPVCTRSDYWCNKNSDQCRNPNQSRCHWQGRNCVARRDNGKPKPHYGYDYSAKCGDPYYAPCDGYLASNKKNGLIFKCKICGKEYVYTFRHNPASSVQPGNYSKNTIIGQVGKVATNACHAHIEIAGPAGASGQPVLMDPFAPGFNEAVCSCSSSTVPDRSSCFQGYTGSGTYDEPTLTTTTGQEWEPDPSGYDSSNPVYNNTGSLSDPDCNYDAVNRRYSEYGCFFCKPFRIIFNTASVMAKKAYDLFAKAVIPLIAVGFAIWLGIIIMKTVSTFNKVEPRIFIKTILGQTFKVLVIVLLLSAPLQQIMDYTIDPVFTTGLKMAQLSAPYSLNDPSACGLTDTVIEDGGLSTKLGNGILCTVKSVQDQIMSIVALGRVCHCLAWTHVIMGFIPNLAYLVTALVLMLVGFMLIFIYPFLLVDTILKLAVVVTLLPLAMAAYALNMNYLKKIWETLLNAMFTFIFLSLIITIIASVADSYTKDILTSELFSSRLGAVLWFTTGGMKLAGVCLLGWALLGEIKPFSSKFGGGIKMDIGGKVGGDAAQLGNQFVAKPVEKAAGKVVAATASGLHKNVSHLHRQINAARIQRFGTAAVDDNGNLMLDDNGNQMYIDRSLRPRNLWNKFRGRETYRSYEKDANGNVSESKIVLKGDYTVGSDGKVSMTGDGVKKVVQRDAFGVLEKAQNANGTTSVNLKVKMGRRKLLDKNGAIDKHTLDMFMQNSLLSDDERQAAIVQQLVEERMGNYVGAKPGNAYKKRKVKTIKDAKGNDHIIVEQINQNGTLSTFEAEFGKDGRVMTTVKTVNGNGDGVEYKTDGIVQRMAVTENGKVHYEYGVSKKYANIARPVYTNGAMDRRIDSENVMFEKEDMKRFGRQVMYYGNRHYDMNEFN